MPNGELDLVARLQRGDPAALSEAYDDHHVAVRAFAGRLTGDASAAEDLVQETFLALSSALDSFRGDASLRTFLISIAANRAKNHVRAATRRRAAHERGAEAPAPPSTPEEHRGRRELAAALALALDELPLEQRIAVVLCEVEERTSAEAAAIIGVPDATVRTRVFHGKRKLREALTKRGFT